MKATTTSASEARQWICELADHHSWEIVAKEMISRMSSDEAMEFIEHFIFGEPMELASQRPLRGDV